MASLEQIQNLAASIVKRLERTDRDWQERLAWRQSAIARLEDRHPASLRPHSLNITTDVYGALVRLRWLDADLHVRFSKLQDVETREPPELRRFVQWLERALERPHGSETRDWQLRRVLLHAEAHWTELSTAMEGVEARHTAALAEFLEQAAQLKHAMVQSDTYVAWTEQRPSELRQNLEGMENALREFSRLRLDDPGSAGRG